jgi:hypothetical protein
MLLLLFIYSDNSGNLQKVKLLRRRGIVWDTYTPEYAAAAGHLQILQVVNTTTVCYNLKFIRCDCIQCSVTTICY